MKKKKRKYKPFEWLWFYKKDKPLTLTEIIYKRR
jgi:hypothetical protein